MSNVTISPASEQGESPPENVTSSVSRQAPLIYERGDTAAEVRPTTRARLAGSVAAVGKDVCHDGRAVMSIRHLTETDLARRWRMSVRTLQAWRWRKIGPPYLKAMGRVLYRLSDIETFEIEHLQGGGR